MARISISLDDLTGALEDHCYFTHYYLDRETGEIIVQSENDLSEREAREGEPDNPFPECDGGERYIPIEPMESRRGFDLMTAFIDGLPEGEARGRLRAALTRRKPFRNFKDALYDYPDIGERWRDFHNVSMEAIAGEWLKHNNIDYELVRPGPGD